MISSNYKYLLYFFPEDTLRLFFNTGSLKELPKHFSVHEEKTKSYIAEAV